MLETFLVFVALLGFLVFAGLTILLFFNAEREELKTKDKRYYYKLYIYHLKEAKKALKKYESLDK
jgi:hypothetical protein